MTKALGRFSDGSYFLRTVFFMEKQLAEVDIIKVMEQLAIQGIKGSFHHAVAMNYFHQGVELVDW